MKDYGDRQLRVIDAFERAHAAATKMHELRKSNVCKTDVVIDASTKITKAPPPPPGRFSPRGEVPRVVDSMLDRATMSAEG